MQAIIILQLCFLEAAQYRSGAKHFEGKWAALPVRVSIGSIGDGFTRYIQCGVVITWSISPQILTTDAHSSSVRTRYGVSFVSSIIHVPLLPLQCCVYFHDAIDRVITALDLYDVIPCSNRVYLTVQYATEPLLSDGLSGGYPNSLSLSVLSSKTCLLLKLQKTKLVVWFSILTCIRTRVRTWWKFRYMGISSISDYDNFESHCNISDIHIYH